MLIREKVARLNICLFCIDIGRLMSIKASLNETKFNSMEEYKTSALFTDKERAALDYVTILVRDKKMDKETFDKAKQV
jgi:alkylhydroperoxidase family enzyme